MNDRVIESDIFYSYGLYVIILICRPTPQLRPDPRYMYLSMRYAHLLTFTRRQNMNADKHSPASSARSTKRRVRGDAYGSGS